MIHSVSNILKKFGRRQWCFIAILSAFTFMGNGDAYNHDLEGFAPIQTEQLSRLAFLNDLVILDFELEDGTSNPPPFTNQLSVGHSDFSQAHDQKIQTAYNHLSKQSNSIDITLFFPKKIPSGEIEDEAANL